MNQSSSSLLTNDPTSPDTYRVFYLDDARTKAFSIATLRALLTEVETALFFCKVYELKAEKLTKLLSILFPGSVMEELLKGAHSTELQGYLVDTVPESILEQAEVVFEDKPTKALILPEVWAALEIEIAASIKEVAKALHSTLDVLPGKEGSMVLKQLMTFNTQRNALGSYKAVIQHARAPRPNLVILDVSGSMTEATIRTLIEDVIGLTWKADAYLAIVSDNTFYWAPGTATVSSVLKQAEYGGTHYESLRDLLNLHDWGTVITIADYDSSTSAKYHLQDTATTQIQEVLDISLVNRMTYLSECLGGRARSVRPLLLSR